MSDKNVKKYYLLAIVCLVISAIFESVSLMRENAITGYAAIDGAVGQVIFYTILNLLIKFVVISVAIFKIPNTKFDIIWQWIKTGLIIGIPFSIYIFYNFALSQVTGSIEGLICIIVLLISIILTIIARKYYRNTEEFKEKQNKRNLSREHSESLAMQKEIEKQEKVRLKQQEKEDEERNEWEKYHYDLIGREMKLYRVSFSNHPKYYNGTITPRCYVETIDKEAAISEAKKIAPYEIKKLSITECVVIAGTKSLNYEEVSRKWKERYHKGYYFKPKLRK